MRREVLEESGLSIQNPKLCGVLIFPHFKGNDWYVFVFTVTEFSGELIDSPGVRDFAPALVSDALVQRGWPEIVAAAPQCRFANCLHLREPGCAVIAGIDAGTLSARRYESYKRLLNIMRDLAPDYERRK